MFWQMMFWQQQGPGELVGAQPSTARGGTGNSLCMSVSRMGLPGVKSRSILIRNMPLSHDAPGTSGVLSYPPASLRDFFKVRIWA